MADRFGDQGNDLDIRADTGAGVEIKCTCGVHLQAAGVDRLASARHGMAPGKLTVAHLWEGLDVTVEVKSRWERGKMELRVVIRAGNQTLEKSFTAKDGERFLVSRNLRPSAENWRPQVLFISGRAMRQSFYG